ARARHNRGRAAGDHPPRGDRRRRGGRRPVRGGGRPVRARPGG
ncbi:MAG: hypothetical protein AVDCRST_MAG08-2464, partial [uncultured Acetobacteraceae bacterium]